MGLQPTGPPTDRSLTGKDVPCLLRTMTRFCTRLEAQLAQTVPGRRDAVPGLTVVGDLVPDELPEADCLVATVAEVDALLNARLVSPAFDLSRTAVDSAPLRSAAAVQLRLTMSTMTVMSGHPGEAVELRGLRHVRARSAALHVGRAELVRLLGVAVLDDLPRAQERAKASWRGPITPAPTHPGSPTA